MCSRQVHFLAALVSLLVVSLSAPAQSRSTYTVSTVGELLSRLGPDRTIILKKGDYRLPSAYNLRGPGFQWLEGDDGKELMVVGADNLVLRGMDGVRIVTDSLKSYLIGFYKASKITIENISFVRETRGDATPEAGLFYAESVDELSLSDLSLGGASGIPLEVWDCAEVALKNLTIADGMEGAISVGKVGNFSASGGSVRDVSGFPLVYVEQSGPIAFEGVEFSDCGGANFLENWGADGGGETGNVSFENCSFLNDDFDYFVGNSNLPETVDCVWSASSFDESWADNSVDWSADQGPGSSGDSTLTHFDGTSGLSFDYPADWDYKDGSVVGQAIVYGSEDDSVIFFAKALDVPKGLDKKLEAPALVAKAFDAFAALLESQVSMHLEAKPTKSLAEWESWQMAEYGGSLSAADGSVAPARLRLALLDKGVWALLVLSPDETKLAEGGQLDAVLKSLTGGREGD